MKPDGNCGFRALSQVKNKTQEKFSEIKQELLVIFGSLFSDYQQGVNLRTVDNWTECVRILKIEGEWMQEDHAVEWCKKNQNSLIIRKIVYNPEL